MKDVNLNLYRLFFSFPFLKMRRKTRIFFLLMLYSAFQNGYTFRYSLTKARYAYVPIMGKRI